MDTTTTTDVNDTRISDAMDLLRAVSDSFPEDEKGVEAKLHFAMINSYLVEVMYHLVHGKSLREAAAKAAIGETPLV